MAIFDNFPYTDVHELNLDWVIKTVRQIKKEWGEMGFSVTANAIRGSNPDVVVTGDLVHGLNFTFTLVKGDKGDTGNTGAQGVAGNGISSVSINADDEITFNFTNGTSFTTPSLRGENGTGLEILDIYPSLADLQTAHPTGSAGDAYLVGVSPSFELYIWSTNSTAWERSGALTSPSPSISTPTMNGVANVGTENAYARGDHVHPSDTTKCSLQQVYPVGSIYMNANVSTNPATLFGFGTWTQLKDKFILACGNNHNRGETGGQENTTLVAGNLPKQQGYFQVHGGGGAQPGTVIAGVDGTVFKTSNVVSGYYRQGSRYSGGNSVSDVIYDNGGSSTPFSNMPPYIAVYVWIRTA
ncbi:MAG: hypothetical protein IKL32_00010 [Alphaproteobacteria bacterium]|nr:hypothetical protein [Alphaproteobacteria bacterium]MBR6674295.1 hypothetical protein [Alphaproteobacteria bacterium]